MPNNLPVLAHPDSVRLSFPGRPSACRWNTLLALFVLSITAICIHGYHLGVEDAEIYLPAIKRVADPSLYPFGSEFFMQHARFSVFSSLVGNFSTFTGISPDWAIFACHWLGVFLLFLAAYQLAALCFTRTAACWSAVGLLALLLSVPVAGTALLIMDPYLTARTLSTPALLFAITACLAGRLRYTLFWITVSALLHPQMAVYVAGFLLVIATVRGTFDASLPLWYGSLSLNFPLTWGFERSKGAAQSTLLSRTYFFVNTWAWYEWVGVFAPMFLLWYLGSLQLSGTRPVVRVLSRALIIFGTLATTLALVIAFTPALQNYARIQPMRAFHIVYLVLFILLGGLLQQYVLRAKPLRWAAYVLPIAAFMYLLAQSSYPHSIHVELPGTAEHNDWVDAFLWVRGHTPKSAIFALDPNYMAVSADDQHGFRAIAERSALADRLKDSGAVSLFPDLAPAWLDEVTSQNNWSKFKLPDFEALTRRYSVSWVVTRSPHPLGLSCPFINATLSVCKLPPLR